MNLKKYFLIGLFVVSISFLFGQKIGVAYHPDGSMIGVNAKVGENFLPELRTRTNFPFDWLPVEFVVNYLFVKKDDYQIYSGLGGNYSSYNSSASVVLPVGINLYPFENKKFGFHIEISGIIGDSEEIFLLRRSYLRGSWGLRYRFY